MTGTLMLLDVGSTNSRGYLVRDGEIVESRYRDVGVRDSARDGSNRAVRSAVSQLIRELAPGDGDFTAAAAGMVTSPQGLVDLPHVLAPASAEDLARNALMFRDAALAPVPILLVPGVRTAGSEAGLADDVMRGEETLALGLVECGEMGRRDLLLNAGSHWKLVVLDDQGRIARSRTSLGGEVVRAVQEGTLLTASLPPGPLTTFVPEWVSAGAAASAEQGLLRALFAVRLLDQRGGTTPEERFAWMAGACIGDDVRALLRVGELTPGSRVLVSGPGAIPAAWEHLLRQAGCEPRVLDAPSVERAFVTGLSRITQLRSQIETENIPEVRS